MNNLKNLSIILPLLALSACKSDISPEWETHYSHAQDEESRVEWLSNIAIDSYGDIISGGSTVLTGADRQKNVLVVKQDNNGQLIWAVDYDLGQDAYRSDDTITDMVLDDAGNTYAVGVRYIVENEVQRYGSFMLKVNVDGELVWVYELSDYEDARDIEISNNQLYVTGYSTQVFNLEGKQQLKINHEKAWDIEVGNGGDIYIVGASKAEKYDSAGNSTWSVDLQANLNYQASLALNDDGSIVIAHNQEDSSTRVSGISSSGNMQWTHTYQPATQSYGFPGPALVKTDWRGNAVLSLSNDKGRRVVKLDDAGSEVWQVSAKGIVQDFVVNDDGAVYVVGGGVNEKYDADGALIATTSATASTQLTTGSVALDSSDMYLGYSAVHDGDIQLYLAKFIDE